VLILSPVMCNYPEGGSYCGGTSCENSKTVATLLEHEDDSVMVSYYQPQAEEGSFKSDNLTRRRREIVEAIMANMNKGGTQTNKCVGGECSQDSDKRDGKEEETSVDASFDERNEISEMQLEKELQEEVDTGAGIESVYATISAYLRGLFLVPDARFNLKYLANTQQSVLTPQVPSIEGITKSSRTSNPSRDKIGSPSLKLSELSNSSLDPPTPSISKTTTQNSTHPDPDSPTLILECSGPITSYCQARHCRMKCIDGRKVEMVCATNSLDIKTSTGVDGISRNTISCSQ